jgi:hypothetical protein
MMVILGCLDLIWGIAAIANNQVVVVGGHGVIILDITTWGWVHILLGVVVALTGLGLLAGNVTARLIAVYLLAASIILQVVWFTAAPLWALLMIALDVVIIHQLISGWYEHDGT